MQLGAAAGRQACGGREGSGQGSPGEPWAGEAREAAGPSQALTGVCVCLWMCHLADNEIGAEGARALAEALRHNSALQHLDLGGKPPLPLSLLWHAAEGGGA